MYLLKLAFTQHGSRPSDKYPPRDWDPLVKQTYSVSVETDKGMRKWHLSMFPAKRAVHRLMRVCSRLLHSSYGRSTWHNRLLSSSGRSCGTGRRIPEHTSWQKP
jgi:hypothetical protein